MINKDIFFDNNTNILIQQSSYKKDLEEILITTKSCNRDIPQILRRWRRNSSRQRDDVGASKMRRAPSEKAALTSVSCSMGGCADEGSLH